MIVFHLRLLGIPPEARGPVVAAIRNCGPGLDRTKLNAVMIGRVDPPVIIAESNDKAQITAMYVILSNAGCELDVVDANSGKARYSSVLGDLTPRRAKKEIVLTAIGVILGAAVVFAGWKTFFADPQPQSRAPKATPTQAVEASPPSKDLFAKLIARLDTGPDCDETVDPVGCIVAEIMRSDVGEAEAPDNQPYFGAVSMKIRDCVVAEQGLAPPQAALAATVRRLGPALNRLEGRLQCDLNRAASSECAGTIRQLGCAALAGTLLDAHSRTEYRGTSALFQVADKMIACARTQGVNAAGIVRAAQGRSLVERLEKIEGPTPQSLTTCVQRLEQLDCETLEAEAETVAALGQTVLRTCGALK